MIRRFVIVNYLRVRSLFDQVDTGATFNVYKSTKNSLRLVPMTATSHKQPSELVTNMTNRARSFEEGLFRDR